MAVDRGVAGQLGQAQGRVIGDRAAVQDAGLTQEEVSERTGKDRSTLYRLENAQQRPQRSTLIRLLDLYGAGQERRAELLALLREAGRRGWMQPHRSDLPAVYSDYISFESEAPLSLELRIAVHPGLLQTEDYTRAVIRGILPHASTAEVENRVTARHRGRSLPLPFLSGKRSSLRYVAASSTWREPG